VQLLVEALALGLGQPAEQGDQAGQRRSVTRWGIVRSACVVGCHATSLAERARVGRRAALGIGPEPAPFTESACWLPVPRGCHGNLPGRVVFARPPGKVKARGKLIASEDGVLAGLPFFRRVFELVDKNISFEARATDGAPLSSGQLVARVSGPAVSVLQAQQTALNFLKHLSGIASQTARFTNAVRGTKTRILGTRSTSPGLGFLEKYAVECGGGVIHLKGLGERLIVTESHLALSDGVPNIVRQLRKTHQGKRIEVTVTNMQELEQALQAKVNVLRLENFPPGQVRQAIALVQGRAKVEITGKVGLDNARAYALAGVDFISVDQLTQSVKAFDFAFRVSR